MVNARAKCVMSFINYGICHRMESFRMLCSITLTFILKVKHFLVIPLQYTLQRQWMSKANLPGLALPLAVVSLVSDAYRNHLRSAYKKELKVPVLTSHRPMDTFHSASHGHKLELSSSTSSGRVQFSHGQSFGGLKTCLFRISCERWIYLFTYIFSAHEIHFVDAWAYFQMSFLLTYNRIFYYYNHRSLIFHVWVWL